MQETDAKGFTLLELVITLAIVAVLAVFAVPSYRHHVTKTHRMDAAAALYRAAQFVEQSAADAIAVLPPGMDQAPQNGTPVYRVKAFPADDVNGGYALEAAPTEAGPASDDSCGTFTLDATGLRGNRSQVTGSGTPPVNECWNTS